MLLNVAVKKLAGPGFLLTGVEWSEYISQIYGEAWIYTRRPDMRKFILFRRNKYSCEVSYSGYLPPKHTSKLWVFICIYVGKANEIVAELNAKVVYKPSMPASTFFMIWKKWVGSLHEIFWKLAANDKLVSCPLSPCHWAWCGELQKEKPREACPNVSNS